VSFASRQNLDRNCRTTQHRRGGNRAFVVGFGGLGRFCVSSKPPFFLPFTLSYVCFSQVLGGVLGLGNGCLPSSPFHQAQHTPEPFLPWTRTRLASSDWKRRPGERAFTALLRFLAGVWPDLMIADKIVFRLGGSKGSKASGKNMEEVFPIRPPSPRAPRQAGGAFKQWREARVNEKRARRRGTRSRQSLLFLGSFSDPPPWHFSPSFHPTSAPSLLFWTSSS